LAAVNQALGQPGTHVRVTGIVSEFRSNRQIAPTLPYDVEALLDNIRSIYNVGSLFRTADGAGLRRLHLCGITATPAQAKVAKTALGAEQAVPWTFQTNTLDAAVSLKGAGGAALAANEHGRARLARL
jgi:23S rRNA (guanosine2251-2'-O)-methyltransferase